MSEEITYHDFGKFGRLAEGETIEIKGAVYEVKNGRLISMGESRLQIVRMCVVGPGIAQFLDWDCDMEWAEKWIRAQFKIEKPRFTFTVVRVPPQPKSAFVSMNRIYNPALNRR